MKMFTIESNFSSELEIGIQRALETYSNVHRGTGHYSIVSTIMFDYAREIFLDYLKVDKNKYVVVFCTPLRLKYLLKTLKTDNYIVLSSNDFNLCLGVRVLAVKKKALSKSEAFQSGGGIVKNVSSNDVIWENIPTKFEAGTPSIINIIAFAKTIQTNSKIEEPISNLSPIESSEIIDMLYQDDFLGCSGEDLMSKLRNTVLGQNIHVPTAFGEKFYINFDSAATTPTFMTIWKLVSRFLHQPIQDREILINEVKKICSDFFSCPLSQYEILFNSNTTEAINIAALNLSIRKKEDNELVVVNTVLEHHSNELPWRYISNAKLIRVSVNDEGFIDTAELEDILYKYNQKHKYGKKRVELVAISGASNVLGTFNDLQAISDITHKYGASLLVDGAQLAAHRKIQIMETNIDYFACSGHKMYAPFGSGVLIIKKDLMKFNKHQLADIKLSGEDNLIGIVALGKALLLLKRIGMDIIENYERNLTQKALNGLKAIPKLKILGIQDIQSPNFLKRGGILSFSLKNVPHNLTAKLLAEYGGIGARNGCFCAHLLVKHILKIHPIRKIGAKLISIVFPKFARNLLPGLVRVSFGIQNDEKEVRHLLNVLKKISVQKLSWVNRLLAYTYNATPFLHHSDIEKQIDIFKQESLERVFSISRENIS